MTECLPEHPSAQRAERAPTSSARSLVSVIASRFLVLGCCGSRLVGKDGHCTREAMGSCPLV